MDYQNLLLNIDQEILYITINRESKLNALNKATLNEMNKAVADALHDVNIGGIIITGAGEKAFVAGADISEFSSFNLEQGKALAAEGQKNVFDLIANAAKPIIAAINGFALGGGLELALACHIRIASENAKMGLPEVTLGLIPGYGGTQRLTQIIGKGRAMEMILTADMITAEQALGFGLVNKVVPQVQLLETATTMMLKILSRSPKGISAAIIAINAFGDKKQDGFTTEIEEFGKCFEHPDFKEGVSAFLEKRKPNFKRQ
jgi:enoyl-CoA hydratase